MNVIDAVTRQNVIDSVTRYEYVTVEKTQEYARRLLDAEGNWQKKIGRKLETDDLMILKDYGKNKFFFNPLQPTERQQQGIHRQLDVKEILLQGSGKKKTG